MPRKRTIWKLEQVVGAHLVWRRSMLKEDTDQTWGLWVNFSSRIHFFGVIGWDQSHLCDTTIYLCWIRRIHFHIYRIVVDASLYSSCTLVRTLWTSYMKAGRGHVCQITPRPSSSRSMSDEWLSPCRYRVPFDDQGFVLVVLYARSPTRWRWHFELLLKSSLLHTFMCNDHWLLSFFLGCARSVVPSLSSAKRAKGITQKEVAREEGSYFTKRRRYTATRVDFGCM